MFEMILFDVNGIIVYCLDKYHARTKPDRILDDGTPEWDSKAYTAIGSKIESYKLQKNRKLLPDLVGLFMESNIVKNSYDVIAPVPSLSNTLHISDVAKEIASQLNIDFCDCLKKYPGVKMKFLSSLERKKQQDFILCSDEIKRYSSVLLIDDIIKTGKTITDCVNKIREQNSECTITGFVFCRGMGT